MSAKYFSRKAINRMKVDVMMGKINIIVGQMLEAEESAEKIALELSRYLADLSKRINIIDEPE